MKDNQKFWLPDASAEASAKEVLTALRERYSNADYRDEKGGHYRDPSNGQLALPPKFWQQRTALKHIHDQSLKGGRPPEAVLFQILSLVLLHTPVSVEIPSLIGGGTGSANFCLAVIAPTGGGKGRTWKLARQIIDHANLKPRVDVLPSGTGEGIIESFMGIDDGGQRSQIKHQVGFYVPEVEKLESEIVRQGSTLVATLRSLAVGESIGNTNASKERSRRVEDGSYRCTYIVAGQPKYLAPLMSKHEISGGTTGRFVFASTDGTKPERFKPGQQSTKSDVVPWRWQPPTSPRELKFPQAARDEVGVWDEIKSHDTTGQIPEIDGYWSLNRMRLATALALLEDSSATSVRDDDWVLSGLLLDYSDAVRAETLSAVAAQARECQEAEKASHASKGLAIHKATVEYDEHRTIARHAKTIGRRVAKNAEKGETETWRASLKAIRSNERSNYPANSPAEEELRKCIIDNGLAVFSGKQIMPPPLLEDE